jgi:hypothetical protein
VFARVWCDLSMSGVLLVGRWVACGVRKGSDSDRRNCCRYFTLYVSVMYINYS